MALTASELHRRGVAAANARRFAEARRLLATASARTDDPDLRARIDGTVAYVLSQVGDQGEAERLTRAALDRAALSGETRALLYGQLGTLLLHAGRLDDADDALTRALDALPAPTLERANLLMNRAVVRMQRHQLADCTADLEEAVAVYESTGDPLPLAEARHNLGYAALLGGDLVTALEMMTRSRPVLAASSDLAAAISDLDRAEVLRDAGLTTEAETLLGEVAARFGAQRMRQARGEAEFHLARSLLRHDLRAAERTAAMASRRFAALGSDGWAARAEAVLLEARVRAHRGRHASPDDVARTAAALDRAGFRTEATGLRLTAKLAEPGPLPRLPADAPTPLRLRAHEVRAVRAAASGRDGLAMRTAAAGLDLLTTWQRSFGALDLQASVAMHGTDLMLTGLAAAARTRDPARLFEWSERARHLSQQVAPLRPPRDAELADDLAELRMLRAELAGGDWTVDARVRRLRDRARQRQWSATGAGDARTRVTLAEAQTAVGADTAVLSYVFTGTELLGVAVTASAARVVPLSWSRVRAAADGLRADLDVAALTRGGPMAAVIEKSLDDRLARLDAALLAPMLAAVGGARRVALTAPGVLGGIPWSMLPGMRGIPFTLALSVSRWLGDRTAGGAPAPLTAPPSAGTTAAMVAGPRVARGEEEVLTAAAAWPDPAVLLGDAASVSPVTELAATSDVLHIAAHGRHAVDNPLFSGFELADGTLFGYDVDLIPRAPETVLLSACELGRSSVRWGEEALGMTRVWLHAGTRCVIATPVVVPDDIACELLAAVHNGLARGVPPADALVAASAVTGHRAPFQCHGDGLGEVL
ncbi:CHAT domain-containing protein [Microbacterium sp. XT11]|uniref:CHAT domain-containing protein n=1 Tax=Microbacterium sp. XT11 TaxID=367477 RepID=UPI000742FEFF|nr:CHAT domain-containing protein [Microbacterium sp. XT11]ALX66093.1 hypothetical protein AB663_000989 [Microbacterium sp. XT11]